MTAMACADCGITIDTRTSGVAERVEGWRVQRKGGGANQIVNPRGQGRWICAGCLAARRLLGPDLSQGTLFP